MEEGARMIGGENRVRGATQMTGWEVQQVQHLIDLSFRGGLDLGGPDAPSRLAMISSAICVANLLRSSLVIVIVSGSFSPRSAA